MLAVLGGLMFADLAAASQAQQPLLLVEIRGFRRNSRLTPLSSRQRSTAFIKVRLPELRQEWDELNKCEAKLSKLLESSTDEALLARQIDRVETARPTRTKTRSR